MQKYLDGFLSYLRIEKNCSPLTITDYRLELEKFNYFLEKENLVSIELINNFLIRNYIYTIKEQRNLSATSTYKKIAILKSYFNYLEINEIIKSNPTKNIKLPRKEKPIPRVVSNDEFTRLISCIKFSPARCRKNYIRDSLIFSILYYCGLRRSELLNLNWDDINLGSKIIYIRSSKNKSGRIIPMHPKVYELFELYLNLRLPLKNQALITGEIGNRLTCCSFNNLIKMYFQISLLAKKGYTAHSLRHGFATRLIEKNVNIFLVQKLLGHSSLDSTKIYVHFDNSSCREAIKLL